jgi:pimeloyl-ACP methyl ester carboxylesterase
MELAKGMAETVAPMMPSAAEIATCEWLTAEELEVCSDQYARTGFQGGLQLYRVAETAAYRAATLSFGRDAIDVPCCFIAGARDWGVFQSPGAFEAMQTRGCRRIAGVHLVDQAGHWVQQEQADRVNDILIGFCQRAQQ